MAVWRRHSGAGRMGAGRFRGLRGGAGCAARQWHVCARLLTPISIRVDLHFSTLQKVVTFKIHWNK